MCQNRHCNTQCAENRHPPAVRVHRVPKEAWLRGAIRPMAACRPQIRALGLAAPHLLDISLSPSRRLAASPPRASHRPPPAPLCRDSMPNPAPPPSPAASSPGGPGPGPDSGSGLRRLAPAAAAAAAGQAMHPPARPPPPRRRRIGISVACEPCRTRKSRVASIPLPPPPSSSSHPSPTLLPPSTYPPPTLLSRRPSALTDAS